MVLDNNRPHSVPTSGLNSKPTFSHLVMRPSGRAVVDFGSHKRAAAALDFFDGGQLMVTDDAERVVMLRPLRDYDQGPAATVVPFPADATAVARHRSMGAAPGVAGSREAGRGAAVPKGVAAAMRARPGDWVCPQCQDLVFARNRACRLCGTRKPAAGTCG